MSLTHESFCGLSLDEQLQIVLTQGVFCATRYEATYAITQYQVREFSADLYYSWHSILPEQIQTSELQPPAR
ncbi:hypothetical protein [Hymenobacter chitinivorans]|uniref:Uncharacterized protein n=1 Tax=Hymenobacter chitinivorans DSM 11115 TaxID=1121954 RepID=A0A2M9BQM2_9BACT|nr:hypothetical protein [Hymenobacter chitinivorans]PJJ60217.1 hypothetical protein CLV45_1642 [Hymenobacter chitinivorans DSM 11115]